MAELGVGPATARLKISVVIASVNGLACLMECLGSLEAGRLQYGAEIIVVGRGGPQVSQAIQQSYPATHFLQASVDTTIPRLRSRGIAAATGDVIAILEDHTNVDPGWYSEILKQHANGFYGVVGGPVENDCRERVLDWATYFCEYSAFMPPVKEGVDGPVPGNNTSYRRESLALVKDLLDKGVWEGFLHAELKAKGVQIYCAPKMLVWHKKPFGFREFMIQRYYLARSYAGMRVENAPLAKKLFYVLASPALPPLLGWRISRLVLAKKRYRREFWRSVPLLGLFLLSWAWGEFCGYLLGQGSSTARVE